MRADQFGLQRDVVGQESVRHDAFAPAEVFGIPVVLEQERTLVCLSLWQIGRTQISKIELSFRSPQKLPLELE
jgi:hypothetical protein